MVHEHLTSHRFSRRQALRLTGAAALASIAPASAAAQASTPTAGGAGGNGMFPSPLAGVPNAYWKYPAPFKTVDKAPGKGGTVKLFIWNDNHISDRSQNQYWQELEKRLGVKLDISFVPGAAYADKMATTIAGGDFPDLMQVVTLLYPQASEFMIQGAYTDLTSYLDEKGRQSYPNLTTFPGYAWTNATLNGKLYGVPSPTALQPNALWYRSDWLQTAGMAPPKNAADFLKMLKAFTANDPDGNGKADTYGLSFERLDAICQRFIHGMFGVPAESDGWRLNPDGSLTNTIETEEFKASLDFMRQVWAAGVCYPDSLTQTSNEVRAQLIAGKAGAGANAFILLGLIRSQAAQLHPKAEVMGLVPPGHDGGKAVTYNIPGFFGMLSIPITAGKSKDRVEELLGICNYFGAPFGSEEYTFLNYGLEGVHYTVNQQGAPTLNDKGKADVFNPSLGGLNVLYDPNKDQIQYVQTLMADQTKLGIFSPTVNLYSPTAIKKASELSQLYTDNMIAIGTGRQPLSALDQWISDWKSRGGDQIRKEYEAAYKQAHG